MLIFHLELHKYSDIIIYRKEFVSTRVSENSINVVRKMIEFKTVKYPVSTIIRESSVPSIGNAINVQNSSKSYIEDYQGLFVGYGRRETCYPYREQNLYTDVSQQDVRIAVLENDCLYAEFLCDYGARLWKLKKKRTGEDLVYANDVIRFRNLSLRNSWFSGGVEWNIGVIGHTAYTCSSLYCAKVTGDNGEEVLRFYEFERVREVYYQIDFWLSEDKLMVKVRIENPNTKVVPMYWWSNIATPEFKGGRLIVDACEAFSNVEGTGIRKTTIPVVEDGTDVSFYENIKHTIDYFFDVKPRSNKFIANVNSEGKGLLQISSSRLQGRKLFTWGHLKGSRHWQDILTDNAGDYIEIQAGLGKTQYECIPMPPKTSWSWVEVYTGVEVPSEMVCGDYKELVNYINETVKDTVSTEILDEVCESTNSSISLKKGEMVYSATGYGYVKNAVEGTVPKHLEFTLCEESKKYLTLCENGEFSFDIRGTVPFAQEEYQIEALRKLAQEGTDNWAIYYELAVYEAYSQNYAEAKSLCAESMVYDNNYLNNHLMAFILHNMNERNAFYFAEKSVKLCSDDYSVAQSVMNLFMQTENYKEAMEIYDLLDEKVKYAPHLRMYLSMCYLKTGDAQKAEAILYENGGLDVPDYREGEKFLNNLYKGIRMAKYGENEDDIEVPMQFNYIVYMAKE